MPVKEVKAVRQNRRRQISVFLMILVVITMAFFLAGCFAKKYTVRYWDGEIRYPAGKEVTLCFDLIATDTDYRFYMNEEPFSPEYDEKKGFVFKFVMPDHDVEMTVVSENSMAALQ